MPLPIHETFQTTVQGEGYWAGCLVDFIRLAGCPVGCSFCDTGYARTAPQTYPRTPRSIDDLISELQSPRVIISGGEPFIHPALPELVDRVLATDRAVCIETSGSYWQPISELAWVTLSPKQHVSPRYPVLPQLWTRANEIKLVISTGAELDIYRTELLTAAAAGVPIYLQPEWNDRTNTVPLVLSLLQQFPQWRLSVQLHKFLGVQ